MVGAVPLEAAIVPFEVVVSYVPLVRMHMLSAGMRLSSTGNMSDRYILPPYMVAFSFFWLSSSLQILYLHYIDRSQEIFLIESYHLRFQLIPSILSVHESFPLFPH